MSADEKQSSIKFSHPTVLVIGTGAVGGFYGAKLSQAGAKVSVLCRSDYAVVKAQGIRISSPQGDFTFIPERVLASVTDYPGQPDYVLVALKALPDIQIAELIKPVLGSNTSVFLLQNGMGNEEALRQNLPEAEIIGGLAAVCLSRPRPGLISHQCYGRITLGVYPSGTSDKAEQLYALFTAAGIPCEVETDIIRARWRKLMWNAPFNPISVLAGGVTTTQILALPDTRQMVINIMQEICRIAEADGHALDPDIVRKNIEDTENMQPFKTSMLQDYLAGRPMEIEAIIGAPLKIARQHKLSTPYLEMTYSLLKLAEQRIHEKKHLGTRLQAFFQTPGNPGE